ncbi:hypothetical protein GCM10020367_71360 [Streptomyces sannanensis]|uniref:Uncharacterized protein n=1 Tax=Streptomyces sannanensis TaxID=285536 RepID=A0ABP6SNQ5_9ACTN
MPTNDNTPGRHQELAYLPVPFPKAPAKPPRFAALRKAVRDGWNRAWDVDGVLYEMWDDVLSAPEDGLRHMAPWLRAVLMTAGVAFVVLMAKAAGDVVLQALHQILTAVPKVQVGVDTSSGVAAVVDQPVRTYIAQHSAGLPVAASTVYSGCSPASPAWSSATSPGTTAYARCGPGGARSPCSWSGRPPPRPADPSRPGSPSSPGRSCPRSRCAA